MTHILPGEGTLAIACASSPTPCQTDAGPVMEMVATPAHDLFGRFQVTPFVNVHVRKVLEIVAVGHPLSAPPIVTVLPFTVAVPDDPAFWCEMMR